MANGISAPGRVTLPQAGPALRTLSRIYSDFKQRFWDPLWSREQIVAATHSNSSLEFFAKAAPTLEQGNYQDARKMAGGTAMEIWGLAVFLESGLTKADCDLLVNHSFLTFKKQETPYLYRQPIGLWPGGGGTFGTDDGAAATSPTFTNGIPAPQYIHMWEPEFRFDLLENIRFECKLEFGDISGLAASTYATIFLLGPRARDPIK